MKPEVQIELREARRQFHGGAQRTAIAHLIRAVEQLAISSVVPAEPLPDGVETTGELMIPDINVLIKKLRRIPKKYGIEESDINFLRAVGQKLGRV